MHPIAVLPGHDRRRNGCRNHRNDPGRATPGGAQSSDRWRSSRDTGRPTGSKPPSARACWRRHRPTTWTSDFAAPCLSCPRYPYSIPGRLVRVTVAFRVIPQPPRTPPTAASSRASTSPTSATPATRSELAARYNEQGADEITNCLTSRPRRVAAEPLVMSSSMRRTGLHPAHRQRRRPIGRGRGRAAALWRRQGRHQHRRDHASRGAQRNPAADSATRCWCSVWTPARAEDAFWFQGHHPWRRPLSGAGRD